MRKRYIIAGGVLLVAICTAYPLWRVGRCEVVLTKNGVPLAGAKVQVMMGSLWAGAYAVDAEGKWYLGWHLIERPKQLYIAITDNKGAVFEGLFMFPEQNNWTVDFSGRTITRTRNSRLWIPPFIVYHATESSSSTDLTPQDKPNDKR